MNVSKHSVRKAFGNAADSYDQAAVIQSEVLERALEKLTTLQPQALNILDLGSGTGLATQRLQDLYGQENYIGLDIALPMLNYARDKQAQLSVCADVENLPFQDNSLEVIFSTSTLQWSNDIVRTVLEVRRVLKEQGLFLFSTFGPSTLRELKHCFQQIDEQPHVNTFLDLHELGDALLACGYDAPVMESEIITVEYSDPRQLFNDLRSTGATNHIEQRSRGLTGKNRMNAVLEEYQQFKLNNGKYPASYEIIYGHGRKKTIERQKDDAEWQPVNFI